MLPSDSISIRSHADESRAQPLPGAGTVRDQACSPAACRRRARTWGALRAAAASIAGITFAVLGMFGVCAPLEGCTPRPEAPRSDGRAPATPLAIEQARTLEASIASVAASVRPATVCLVFEDEESNRRGTGSGVIVAADAFEAVVLTCGHVTRDVDRKCSVVLPDGRLFRGHSAATAMSDGVDLGLVIFRTEGASLPIAELAPTLPSKGDWVVVLGHPRGLWLNDEDADEDEGDGAAPAPRWRTDSGAAQRDSDRRSLAQSVRPPVVRAGVIWSEPTTGDGLRFDAPLEAGDSGGPVLDLSGRVVAIASRCGWKSFWNWGSSTAPLAGNPRLLLGSDELAVEGRGEAPGAGAGDARLPDPSRDAPARLDGLGSLAGPVSGSVAIIEADGGPRAFAVAVRGDGLFVTKGSEVGFASPLIASHRERRVPAERIAYDADADLLLLRAESLELPEPHWRRTGEPAPGSLLLNVGDNGEILSTGTVALEGSRQEDIDGRPFLGLAWRSDRDGGMRVQSVVPGTPAARAGVRRGDLILSIDGEPVGSDRTLADWIAERRMGERLRLELARGEQTMTVSIMLDRRHPSIRARERGNTRSAISRVVPHRTQVWKQDGVVAPEQCGSPVVDLDGRVVGINAARLDRTATVVMPAEELLRRVDLMLARGNSTPELFAELASESFAVTESNGRLRLSALDARFVGPRRLARVIGNALTPDGSGVTILADDRLVWDAMVESPGRFEVVYFGGARGSRSARLTLGDSIVESPIAEGRHRNGLVLGEVDVATTGRVPMAFEWTEAGHGEVPGSLDRIELRRLGSVAEPGQLGRRGDRGRSATVAGRSSR